jgi:hypothetical protein
MRIISLVVLALTSFLMSGCDAVSPVAVHAGVLNEVRVSTSNQHTVPICVYVDGKMEKCISPGETDVIRADDQFGVKRSVTITAQALLPEGCTGNVPAFTYTFPRNRGGDIVTRQWTPRITIRCQAASGAPSNQQRVLLLTVENKSCAPLRLQQDNTVFENRLPVDSMRVYRLTANEAGRVIVQAASIEPLSTGCRAGTSVRDQAIPVRSEPTAARWTITSLR